MMATVLSVTELPVVDLGDPPGQLRKQLREVAHEVGFFYLTGHGVPDALIGRALDAARRLFGLPQADKDAVATVRSPHFRGYTRLGGELTGGWIDVPARDGAFIDSLSAGNSGIYSGEERRCRPARTCDGRWCRCWWLPCGYVSVPVVAHTRSAGGVVGALPTCPVCLEPGRGAAAMVAAGPSRSWV